MGDLWETFRARDTAGWEYELRVYAASVPAAGPVTARRIGAGGFERACCLGGDAFRLARGGATLIRIRAGGGDVFGQND
ncbi:MAG TPA: hypothetical protein VHR66_05675 [Gemmataceae bacterium]|jgi:hypothetical protein|nr:hypothetical protein [Gemmataceae bacterium]